MGAMSSSYREAGDGVRHVTAAPQVRFLVRITYLNEAIRIGMYLCTDGVTR